MAQRSAFATAAKLALYRLIGANPAAARYLDLYLSRRAYRHSYGREPDLVNPRLFSEKVMARKLFEQRPIFWMLADKLKAREFAAARIGEGYLPRLLAVAERFDDIDFTRLPQHFVIKPNHGSQWAIVNDGHKPFDIAVARKLVNSWMRTDYYWPSRERFYRQVERRVMVEECLEEPSGDPVMTYRFFVFDSVPRFYYAARKSHDGRVVIQHFDENCRLLPVRLVAPGYTAEHYAARSGEVLPVPSNIGELFELARRLGAGFDLMRVDLYDPGGRALFGEYTTLSGGGLVAFDPPEYDRIFGEMWKLALSEPHGAGDT
jgi:teichuronopeptide biosynthesis TupA-like protein